MNADAKIAMIISGIQNSILPGFMVIIVIAAAAGIGVSLLKATSKSKNKSDLFELVLAVALGLGLCGYMADLVYMIQIMNMSVFFWCLAFVGSVLLVLSRDYVKTAFQDALTRRYQNITTFDRVFFIAGWFAVGIAIFKLYVANVMPVWDNDSILHYANLSKMIAGGLSFDDALLLRKMPITDLNRVIHMIYAFGYTVGGEGCLHLVNFVFIAISLFLVQFFCSYCLGMIPVRNPLPLLIGFNIFELSSMAGLAKVDCGVAMLILSSILAIITKERRSIWIVSLFLGVTLSARINTLSLAPVFLLVIVLEYYHEYMKNGVLDRTKAFLSSLKASSAIVLAGFFIAAPPYVMNFMVYGNPVYPFFNGLFGEYVDFYDYALFKELRYDVSGPLGPILIYIQACATAFIKLLTTRYPDVLGVGLGPLFILAPFAWSKTWSLRMLLLFFILGFLSWALSANTYRTLIGIAYVGVILITYCIIKSRKFFFLYFALCLYLLSVTAFIFLHGRVNTNQFAYFSGRIDRDAFYQEEIRKKNPLMHTLDVRDINAVKNIVGKDTTLGVNVILHAHPDFFNSSILSLSGKDMKTLRNDIAINNEMQFTSDQYAYELALFNPFIQEQYRRLENIIWPRDGGISTLDSRYKKWMFARLYYDARYNVSDAIRQNPARIVSLLKIQGIKYLVASTSQDVFQNADIRGLKRIFQSGEISLFKVIEPTL